MADHMKMITVNTIVVVKSMAMECMTAMECAQEKCPKIIFTNETNEASTESQLSHSIAMADDGNHLAVVEMHTVILIIEKDIHPLNESVH